MLLKSLRKAREHNQLVHNSMLFIMHPLIRFSSFSRQGDSQEWYSPLPASQSSHSPLPTTQIFRPTRAVRFVFNSSTKIPYPRVSSHQVRNLPILCQLCQWRSDRRQFLYPVTDSVRQLTLSLLPTRANNSSLIGCAMMRLALAWIAKRL